jgi:hypothetical protein
MTPEQQRVILAICISVGLTFLVGARLAFHIEPMSEDLRSVATPVDGSR